MRHRDVHFACESLLQQLVGAGYILLPGGGEPEDHIVDKEGPMPILASTDCGLISTAPSISNLSTTRRHCRRRLSRLGWVRSIARRRQAPGDRLCPTPLSVGLAQRSLGGVACGQHNRNGWAGKHCDTRNQAQYRLQSLQTDARRRPRAAKPLPHVVGAGRLWLVIGNLLLEFPDYVRGYHCS